MFESKTIAALATPTGKGGIGIIRISGDCSLELSLKHFKLPNGQKPNTIETHKVYYGFIHDDNGSIVDEVLFIHMKAPRSYTAEDVVEIQSHSSPVVLRSILALLVRGGVDIAEPGEFTKRAYLNGRIDLTQAEAVIDVINARTETSLGIAVSQIEGALKKTICDVKETLNDFHARVEAVIDFPDEVGDIIDQDLAMDMVFGIKEKLDILKKNHEDLRVFRDGVRIVIAGPPNSGKSSLLNALLNKEKAIVTPIPGTTRDLIEDLIIIDGIPIEITDTAGIHQTSDIVEQVGIRKTMEKIELADLVILMLDASKTPNESECESITTIYNNCIKTKKTLVVENKIDLVPTMDSGRRVPDPHIGISVLNRINIDALKTMISDLILKDMPENRCALVPNVRQYTLIGDALGALNHMIHGFTSGVSYDLMAVDIKACIGSLDKILGINTQEDVLDRIFSSFCIGK